MSHPEAPERVVRLLRIYLNLEDSASAPRGGGGEGEGVFAVGWAYLVDVDFGIGW